ncbi:accessory gene regulator B family protein [Macrococcus brunensis]|uniref:accessory gene regulator B family protein n=1 Tax=Macrococcus brunensis TaxID=198483 RepID=UPI001EF1054B|nr:accessory gene regulator B family protein [Macrococcus brunensis]ULG72198.1 accessory gene regulator B family protein [Macrococcus brunensis]
MFGKESMAHLSELEYLKFKRGVRVIMKNTFISLTIYIASMMLGIFWYMLVAHLCYFSIRYFSFGAHLKNFWLCFIQSLAVFVFIPYLLIHHFPGLQLLYIGLFAGLVIWMIAPQPTKAQPIHEYMYQSLRTKTRMTVMMWLILSQLVPEVFSQMMLYGIIIQAITLVITYMRRNSHVSFHSKSH